MPEMPAYEDLLSALIKDGFYNFGEILNKDEAGKLYQDAITRRNFGPDLFLSEKEYSDNPMHFGVNPRPGRNYLEALQPTVGFIENNAYLNSILEPLLGSGYWIHNKKLVCGIPDIWIPEWLKNKMENAAINNLGAYIRTEYRDITYFHGIDFHQDIIDWPSWPQDMKTHKFVTLYVYLHDVTEMDSPLYVLPGTHRFGTSSFPHTLNRQGTTNEWLYQDDQGRSLMSKHIVLTGGVGYAALWQSCLLHGTPSISSAKRMRLSVRYILARSRTAEKAGIDDINCTVDGPLYIDKARRDLDATGKVVLNQNNIKSKTESRHET